jgi:hypothetical protein
MEKSTNENWGKKIEEGAKDTKANETPLYFDKNGVQYIITTHKDDKLNSKQQQ